MKHICDLVKDREVYFVDPGRSVLDSVRYMVERNIGAVAVVQDGNLVGIFSERDLMRRVVSEGRDPGKTPIQQVMTADPLVVSPNESVDDCMRLMKENSFRHLPVCDGRKLRGLISVRDLILHDLTEKEGEVQMMRAYISTNT
jgi:CBS domain-containing protein